MDTTSPKYPFGLKLIFSIVGLAAISLVCFVAWLGYLDLRDFIDSRSPMKLTANSSLIIIVRFDTNAPLSFVVTDIWKQIADTSAQPIKVGARFPVDSPKDAGPLPDGEVISITEIRRFQLLNPSRNLFLGASMLFDKGALMI